MDAFARKQETGRPAVIILSGSRGFKPLAYDEIAASLVDAGLDVYLAHLLSQDDLKSIQAAKDSRARIAYYEKRRRDWLARLAGVVHHIRHQEHHAKTGLLGISLGAETAAIAISEGLSVDAAVLVAGVPSATIRSRSRHRPCISCGAPQTASILCRKHSDL
ncbi:dienelactone hydrolase family protein [Agrobacterium sp. fls2-241-TYG-188a]|uniref:dienelactone hydrolase family protein n=1 Tax=Agrobacterium sp. fls2-241-TYG-188a TaxID=3040275 RepID=UPI00254CF539|nr:dienelactone hydrolase family protein [Agrobacterium sp. fls2-241-TYG-188a]